MTVRCAAITSALLVLAVTALGALWPPTASAQDEPACRTIDLPVPAAPADGAMFARRVEGDPSKVHVVTFTIADEKGDNDWTVHSCGGDPVWQDVMSHPEWIRVAPGAAVLLKDEPGQGTVVFPGDVLLSAWGAKDVTTGSRGAVLFPGDDHWVTNLASIVPPDFLLDYANSCRDCSLPGATAYAASDELLKEIAYSRDVSGANLSGTTFDGPFDGLNATDADLGGAIFRGDSLTGAVLDHTVVSGANFTGADLRGAHLTGLRYRIPPDFTGVRIGPAGGACTVFRDTDLVGARFDQVKVDPGCDSSPLLPGSRIGLGQELVTSQFNRARLDFTDATFVADGADRAALAGADLQGVKLEYVRFAGFPADLQKTNFSHASLQHSDFELAKLSGARFQDADAAGASFVGADLAAHGDVGGASFAGSTTDLQDADFATADISHASFQGADISRAVFNRALAVGTDFNSVKAVDTGFSGAHIYGDGRAFQAARDLQGADFAGAVLAGDIDSGGGFDFTQADLKTAKFDQAQCIDCNFTGADLDGANFSSSYLPGVVLAGAHLDAANLTDAWLYCGNQANGSCERSASEPLWYWPLALGVGEDYGPVPFAATSLAGASLQAVNACPDRHQPSAAGGCDGRLLPDPIYAPPIPAPCSAAGDDVCPTTTSTVLQTPQAPPLSVAVATPPTWATEVTTRGYYVGYSDGTIALVGDGSPRLVAGDANHLCPTASDPCGDGGLATEALLGTPAALAVGLDGALYVADPTLHRVRRIAPEHGSPSDAQTPGTIETVAGDGRACLPDEKGCGNEVLATDASLAGPFGIAAGPSGALYIADGRRGVREVHPDGEITTVGAGGGDYDVRGVVEAADGLVYTTSVDPSYLLKIDPSTGKTTQVAGTGVAGYNGNTGPVGNLLPSTHVQLDHPMGVSIAPDGDVVFADAYNSLIRAYVPRSSHLIELGGLISDTGPERGFNGDGRFADQTELNLPYDVAVTRNGRFVVADTVNRRVRELGSPSPG